MSYSTQQLRKTCTTHAQTQDWTIHFDWCFQSVTLLFTAKSTNTHKHTLQLHWPLRTQSPKRSTTKSSWSVPTLQNPLQETFVPPPWQPPTVIDHRKTTYDQVFWRLHLSFNFLLSKDNSVHLFFLCIPKNHYKLLCHFFGLISKTWVEFTLKKSLQTSSICVVF